MYKRCPNCGEKIKDGLLITNRIVDQNITDEINSFFAGENSEAYCSICSRKLLDEKGTKTKTIEKDYNKPLFRLASEAIKDMPVVTTHAPYEWKYKTCGIVTGLANMGTGVFSSINASVSDVFGIQSDMYNKKIIQAEKSCLNQLKIKALNLGGNAVIGIDIDYNEIGGGKEIQMVAMSGTAVKLQNIESVMRDDFDDDKYKRKCEDYYKLKRDLNKKI